MLRSLGSSEYGIYSICNTVSSAIAMLDSGFGIAAVRFIVRSKHDNVNLPNVLGTLSIINFVLGAIAMAIMSTVVLHAERIFGASMTMAELASVKTILWITGGYLSLTFISSIFPAIVVAHERFIFIKIVDIAKSIMLPVLIVPFLLHGYKAIAMSLITVVVFLLMNVAKLIYCYIKLDTHISFRRIDWALIKEAMPFASIVIFKLFLDRVYWSGGQFILGVVSGTTAVAILALAIQLSGYYNTLALSINNMFLPRCTELSENGNIEGLSNLFLKVGRIQTFILGIFLSVFVVYGKLFIKLWAGSEYGEAFFCCLLIMVPYTVPLVQGICNSILQALDKLKFQTIVFLGIVVVILGLSFPLGRSYGATGCALTISVCIIGGEIIAMNCYYKKIGLAIATFWKQFFSVIIVYAIAVCVFSLVNQRFCSDSWLYFVISVALMLISLLLLTFLFLMNKEEKNVVIKIVSKLLR